MESFKNFSADVVKDMEQLQKNLKNAKERLSEENVKTDQPKEEKVPDAVLKTMEEPKKAFKADFLFRK